MESGKANVNVTVNGTITGIGTGTIHLSPTLTWDFDKAKNCFIDYPYKYTPYTYPLYWDYLGSATVYKYQISCPVCQTLNWCEINKTVTCKCGELLKAVGQYTKIAREVPVKQ